MEYPNATSHKKTISNLFFNSVLKEHLIFLNMPTPFLFYLLYLNYFIVNSEKL